MSDGNGAALRVALAYHRAWTGGRFDEAMTYVADDVVCDAPAGRIAGATAYREFMAPFAAMLIRAELLAAYGDEERAVIVYDTATTLVASGPAAECVAVRDGRTVVSDGPMAEAKEHLAGFYLVECSAERAVEIAARTPDAEWSEVLVRPVLDLAAHGL